MTSSKLAQRIMGVDVAKGTLAVSDSQGKITAEVLNTSAAITAKIARKLGEQSRCPSPYQFDLRPMSGRMTDVTARD